MYWKTCSRRESFLPRRARARVRERSARDDPSLALPAHALPRPREDAEQRPRRVSARAVRAALALLPVAGSVPASGAAARGAPDARRRARQEPQHAPLVPGWRPVPLRSQPRARGRRIVVAAARRLRERGAGERASVSVRSRRRLARARARAERRRRPSRRPSAASTAPPRRRRRPSTTCPRARRRRSRKGRSGASYSRRSARPRGDAPSARRVR